jgi:hypothetical protein
MLPAWFYVLNAIIVGLCIAAFSLGMTGMYVGVAVLLLSQSVAMMWRRRRSQVVVTNKFDAPSARYIGGYYLLFAVIVATAVSVQKFLEIDSAMIIAGGIILVATLILPPLADRKLRDETLGLASSPTRYG